MRHSVTGTPGTDTGPAGTVPSAAAKEAVATRDVDKLGLQSYAEVGRLCWGVRQTSLSALAHQHAHDKQTLCSEWHNNKGTEGLTEKGPTHCMMTATGTHVRCSPALYLSMYENLGCSRKHCRSSIASVEDVARGLSCSALHCLQAS